MKLQSSQNPAVTKRESVFRQDKKKKITTHTPNQILNTRHRLFLVWCILMAAILGLVINLYKLQIVQGAKLTEKARNQQMVTLQPFIPRRMVVDRNHNILACDRLVYTLYAHPKLFKQSDEQVAQKLAPILNKNANELVKIFQSQKSGILLASALPEETVTHVTALHFNGLELTQKYLRFYPENDLVADVVGYINTDRNKSRCGIQPRRFAETFCAKCTAQSNR